MKKNTLVIIILCLVILLAMTIIILFNLKSKNSNFTKEGSTDFEISEQKQYDDIDGDTFYSIEAVLQTYIDSINDKEYTVIYNMLSKTYIEDNNINRDNIEEYMTHTEEASKVWVLDLKQLKNDYDIDSYAVHAIITNSSKNLEKEIYLEFYIDKVNVTFSITPTNKTSINDINIENTNNSIERNDDNTYKKIVTNDKYILNKYIQFYRYNTMCNPERAYNLLDEKYRNTKFADLAGYTEYIKEKPMSLLPEFSKYTKRENDTYVEYVCIDIYDNYYIFRETSIMDFELILDTYTIDLPEFTDKYNSATEQQKVILNIDKFFKAINDQSYYYAYNCLSDSFKNNYFKTQESFENYVKENFYENNYIGYLEFDAEGEIYTYKIQISDDEEGQGDKKEKTIIMKVNEGTDFEMSFNV